MKKRKSVMIGILCFFMFLIILPSTFLTSSSSNVLAQENFIDGSSVYEIVKKEMEDYQTTASSSRGQKYRNWIDFGDETGKKGKSSYYAWCATFASYILDVKLGLFTRENLSDKSASNLYKKLKAKNLDYHEASYEPQPGDLVFWIAKNGQGHVGFATGDGGAGKGHFISGNWADSVKLGKIRPSIQDAGTTKHLVGYITLNYKNKTQVDASGITGSNKKETIWNILVQNGFSKESAAAVMGNIQQEKADWNEAADTSSGLGLFQLTGGRRVSCISYCEQKYHSKYSYKGQIEFMMNIDAPAQFKSYTGKVGTYPNHVDKETGKRTEYGWKERMTFAQYKILSSPSNPIMQINISTTIWTRVYERAGQPFTSKRQKYAIDFYNLYGKR